MSTENPILKETGQPLISMGDLDIDSEGKEKVETKETGEIKDTPKVEMVEVTLGEQKHQVPAAIAAALEAAKLSGTNVQALEGKVAELTNQIAAMAKPSVKKAEDGYEVLLFTNPDAAIAKLTEEITAKVRSEVNATNAQRDFWTEFYRLNSELREYEGYVQYVFARDKDKHAAAKLTVGEAISKIAESSKSELLKMRGGVPLNGKSKTVGEGGSEGNSRNKDRSKNEDSEDKSGSTASILNARRQARREGARPSRK